MKSHRKYLLLSTILSTGLAHAAGTQYDLNDAVYFTSKRREDHKVLSQVERDRGAPLHETIVIHGTLISDADAILHTADGVDEDISAIRSILRSPSTNTIYDDINAGRNLIGGTANTSLVDRADALQTSVGGTDATAGVDAALTAIGGTGTLVARAEALHDLAGTTNATDDVTAANTAIGGLSTLRSNAETLATSVGGDDVTAGVNTAIAAIGGTGTLVARAEALNTLVGGIPDQTAATGRIQKFLDDFNTKVGTVGTNTTLAITITLADALGDGAPYAAPTTLAQLYTILQRAAFDLAQ